MLHWVQLQVLSSDGQTVLQDRIDNTTRETWDAQSKIFLSTKTETKKRDKFSSFVLTEI